ncbi:MAG: RIP metalloprotease RseP [Acetobacter sp.]|nr:RIP metalloprotease RseP [Acetobacter sp.]MBR2123904.1 RIP metalloprotease RseP [Acetobacter sp.]
MIHDYLRLLVSFAFVLCVLVMVHELGHYLAARWRGVHIDVFSIGFGPALVKWHDRVGTEWRLCVLPLGGYVRPHGFEDPEDATEEQKASWIAGRTFHDKSVGSRAIVILAGPLFNFILAFVIFALLASTVGKTEVRNKVMSVIQGSAAAQAGVKPGDVIQRLGQYPIVTVSDLLSHLAGQAGVHTTLTIKREGHVVVLPITIGTASTSGEVIKSRQKGQLGVVFAVETTAPLPVWQAIIAGWQSTWDITKQTLFGLWSILTGKHSARDLGGPLKIAQLSGQAAQYGFASLLLLIAILSVNLGLINLFPIPLLDGGRLVFYAVEAARGKPISKRMQEIAFQAGFVILVGIFLFSILNDLAGFGLFKRLFYEFS